MDSNGGAYSYPKWLSDCKLELSRCKEWSKLRADLQAAVDQQLTESHVDQFAHLTQAERKMFLQRALSAVKKGDQYDSFNSSLIHAINRHVNSHVAQQLRDGSGFQPLASKSDLIIDQANEASMSLLTRWPELRSKLHRCFNKTLPLGLRELAWRLFLSEPAVKSKYLTRLERDAESTMSVLDLDIVQKCDALLQAEPTFKSLAYNSNILHAMKAVLSYHHACRQTRTPLLDTDYLLAVPLLVSTLTTMAAPKGHRSNGSGWTPLQGRSLTAVETEGLVTRASLGTLVERFSTLMATRPPYMTESYNQDFKEAMKQCSSKIAGSLEVLDRGLADHLLKLLNKEGKKLPLPECIKQVTRPMVRALFVGYLSLDAILYVWDQHLIGLDAPEYDIIPAITIIIFLYLKKQLLTCNTASEVTAVLKTESSKLKKEQLMHGIHKHFHKELYAQLVKDGGRPVLDPTQMPVPWQDWHTENLPPVIRPEDRQITRQRRKEEEARERQLQKEREEERQNEEQRRKEQTKKRWQQQLNEAEEEYSAREAQLIKLLEEEKQQRVEALRRADKEMDRLRKEIEDLKKSQKQDSKPSVEPIPPSQVGKDVLKGVMKAAQKLATGTRSGTR